MMILRPVRPHVAHRAADLEAAGRVDQQAVALGVQLDAVVQERLQLRLHDELADVGCQQRVEVDVGGVLRGDDDCVEAGGLVTVVLDGDLGLPVRAQVRDGAVLADLGEAAREPVRQVDRERHELGRLVAGVAEHQPLVARTLPVQLVPFFTFGGTSDPMLVRRVDTLRDVGRLGADGDGDSAGGAVEALLGGVVADLQDLLAHELRDRRVGLGRDLTGDVHEAGGDQRLHGDAGGGSSRSSASRIVSLIWSAILSG